MVFGCICNTVRLLGALLIEATDQGTPTSLAAIDEDSHFVTVEMEN
jgi:hypothetical protein